jgi:ribose/xylose/arabinose/galactoside ABC-type transport system permease subunit
MALIVIAIYANSQANGEFFTPGNLSFLVDETTAIGTIALAAGLVLLVGEIDLSLGIFSYVCGAVMGVLSERHGVPAVPAMLAALLVGAGLGANNGVLVAIVRLPSAYVTLVAAFMGSVFAGLLAYAISPQTTLQIFDPTIQGIEGNGFTLFSNDLRIPPSAVIFLVLILLVWFVLRLTRFGQSIYAIGHDAKSAREAGTQVIGIRLAVFVLAGTLAALGGIFAVSRSYSVSAFVDQSHLLFFIAAPVIGGISLFGGRGSVWAVLLGALVCSCIIDAGALTNQGPALLQIVDGIALVAVVTIAVAGDIFLRRQSAASVQ